MQSVNERFHNLLRLYYTLVRTSNPTFFETKKQH